MEQVRGGLGTAGGRSPSPRRWIMRYDKRFHGGVDMSDGNVVWSVLGVVGSAAGVAALVGVVLRVRLRARTLTQGMTAQARCLETYLTVATLGTGPEQRISTERHVIMGFRTPDGQDVRFRDRSGTPRVTGDQVRVRYLPERPQRAVIADQHPSGITGRLVAGAVSGLVIVAVGVTCTVLGARESAGGAAGGVTTPAPPTSHTSPFPGSGWGPEDFPTSVVICTDGPDSRTCSDQLASLFPQH
ncbi:DUF3592 domain-containing protein [Kitasatospora xanthocidica]|uniref:DUF3592 domain-containing protein n=1 Tax=Kitasatospora xanthocidica TaxID=83382 RepID=UPI0036E59E0A